MNTVWVLLIAASVVFSVVTGRLEAFTTAMFDGAKAAVEVSLFLLGIIALWLGITKILEDAGLIYRISRFFRPLVSRLFKGLPEDHPSVSAITLNFLANLFGLGNAATPLGIKAMQELQSLNKDKESVSFEMMLFIVINTASVQFVPFTVIGILSAYGSRNPAAIVLPTVIATVLSAVIAVALLFGFRKAFK